MQVNYETASQRWRKMRILLTLLCICFYHCCCAQDEAEDKRRKEAEERVKFEYTFGKCICSSVHYYYFSFHTQANKRHCRASRMMTALSAVDACPTTATIPTASALAPIVSVEFSQAIVR